MRRDFLSFISVCGIEKSFIVLFSVFLLSMGISSAHINSIAIACLSALTLLALIRQRQRVLSAHINAIAIASLSAPTLLALTKQRQRIMTTWLMITETLLLSGSLALFMHKLPGFDNVKLLDNVSVGPLSLPFSLYINLDKALVPILLLSCLPSVFRTSPLWAVSRTAWVLLILSVPALLLLATSVGGLSLEFHRPEWLWQFILINLLLVCLAEEALFRGYLQQRLTLWLGRVPALLISALLFGFAHLQGGMLLVMFAALAGLIYGLAWAWSGRLWVSVLLHFLLNLLHLLFFTYPALK